MDSDELRLDEVNDHLKLYQIRDGLTFGTDALLLAAYVKGGQGLVHESERQSDQTAAYDGRPFARRASREHDAAQLRRMVRRL